MIDFIAGFISAPILALIAWYVWECWDWIHTERTKPWKRRNTER